MTGSDLDAVILAAGRGMRMGPLGKLTPKGLFSIGGERLVERSVRLLKERGIKRVRIVTGHLGDQYEALFGQVAGVELIHNPEYAQAGSLRSMMVGLEGLNGPVALLESDLIYERRALASLGPDQTLIMVSGETKATDEVYVWAQDQGGAHQRFVEMSKDITCRAEPHHGELAGVTCFSAESVAQLKTHAEAQFAASPASDYELAVVNFAQETPLACHKIDDLAWAEMDDETMYARARDVVWPRIQANDAHFSEPPRL